MPDAGRSAAPPVGGKRVNVLLLCGLHPVSEDTELGVSMELEAGHGQTKVYAGVQA
jgi:hypothetical protein